MLTRERMQEIDRLNLLPNNVVALKMLPWEWHDGTLLHVLALALWGIIERGINVELRGLGVTMDEVEATVVATRNWTPANAMVFIDGATDDEQALYLDPGESPETNAFRVLESIMDQMVATAP